MIKVLCLMLVLGANPVTKTTPSDDKVLVYDRDGIFAYHLTGNVQTSCNESVNKYLDKYYKTRIQELHDFKLRACVGKKCFRYSITMTFNVDNLSPGFLEPTKYFLIYEE